MDVGLPKEFDKRPGSETFGQQEAAAEARGQKKNYIVRYRNLQFYLKQGMKL